MRRKSCISLAKKFKTTSLGPKATSEIIKRDINLYPIKAAENEHDVDISKPLKHLKKMSNDELEALLTSQDDFILDCLLDQAPMLKMLNKEHANLKKQVNDLANFNYAREPEFVRDRLTLRDTLDDVATLRRRVTKHLQPILNKLELTQKKLSTAADSAQKESEQVEKSYLEGATTQDTFIELYVKLRKEAHGKRMLADKLTREKNMLTGCVPKPFEPNSPIPTPRQRKRVNFNK